MGWREDYEQLNLRQYCVNPENVVYPIGRLIYVMSGQGTQIGTSNIQMLPGGALPKNIPIITGYIHNSFAGFEISDLGEYKGTPKVCAVHTETDDPKDIKYVTLVKDMHLVGLYITDVVKAAKTILTKVLPVAIVTQENDYYSNKILYDACARNFIFGYLYNRHE